MDPAISTSIIEVKILNLELITFINITVKILGPLIYRLSTQLKFITNKEKKSLMNKNIDCHQVTFVFIYFI